MAKEKITLLLSDTHFGIKQNSTIWLNSQVNAIRNEFVPKAKTLVDAGNYVQIVHCGDLFDSRSSINTYTAYVVKELFAELAAIVPIYIIAGNHDFYSQTESDYSALELLLGSIDNITIVKDKCYVLDDSLLVPWYEFDKTDVLKNEIAKHNIKKIFCHTDLARITDNQKAVLKDITVYSGHIHKPSINNNLITLGSSFALTFADHDQQRGYYVLSENGKLEFVPFETSIKFYRIYNNKIFSIDPEKYKNDYVEIYVNKLDLLNEQYSKCLEKIIKTVRNVSIIPLFENKNSTNQNINFADFNIEKLCIDNVSAQLKQKLQQIIDANKTL